jgi:hypothetical protein
MWGKRRNHRRFDVGSFERRLLKIANLTLKADASRGAGNE